jgi:hypothetical protein
VLAQAEAAAAGGRRGGGVQLLRKGRGRERGEIEVKKKEGERRDERVFFSFLVFPFREGIQHFCFFESF